MKNILIGTAIGIITARIVYHIDSYLLRLDELEEVVLATLNKIKKHDTLFRYNDLRIDVLEDATWFKEEEKDDTTTV